VIARRAARAVPAPLWALAVLVVAGALSVLAARRAAEVLPAGRALEELAYYPSGRWLAAASLGERATLADLTWLRGVQYYGEHRESDNRFELMYHVFDIVTGFDPRHQNAYVFGGTSLAQEGKQFERGLALLEKARAADPAAWAYPFEIGFLHFVQRRAYGEAALWFREAARKPGCPAFVGRFAAYAAGRAGHRTAAIELWERVAEASENRVLRAKAIAEVRRLALGTPQWPAAERWAQRVQAEDVPRGGNPG
jgi:tetratricopeptide (TPR) repeat protein